jgi:hypothetical protein
VHHLTHRLAARGDGHHVVAGLDEIAGPSSTESSAASPTASLADRGFGGAQIDLTTSCAALPAPTSSLSARGSIGAARRAN